MLFRQKEIAMLVLTRKLNEQIQIGDDVTITVLRVKGNTIRLGIDAPRSTRVVRGELERFADEGEAVADEALETAAGSTKPTAPATSTSPLAAFMPARLETMPAELSA